MPCIVKVVSPYSSEDAKGLLKAAIRDSDPGKWNHVKKSFMVDCNCADI